MVLQTFQIGNQGINIRLAPNSFLTSIGVAGGFIYIVKIVLGLLLVPLARHSFYFQAFEQLYLARTTQDLFTRGANANLGNPIDLVDLTAVKATEK